MESPNAMTYWLSVEQAVSLLTGTILLQKGVFESWSRGAPVNSGQPNRSTPLGAQTAPFWQIGASAMRCDKGLHCDMLSGCGRHAVGDWLMLA
jgi:hypothetical protein